MICLKSSFRDVSRCYSKVSKIGGVLLKICEALDYDISDIMEVVPGDDKIKEIKETSESEEIHNDRKK